MKNDGKKVIFKVDSIAHISNTHMVFNQNGLNRHKLIDRTLPSKKYQFEMERI
jgi:peptidyl-tRNA hydrolase